MLLLGASSEPQDTRDEAKNKAHGALLHLFNDRVYKIDPGDCSEHCEPIFKEFVGFYVLQKNANRIADIDALIHDDTRVAVVEQKSSEIESDEFPPKRERGLPVSWLCVVDITSRDPVSFVLPKKKCILNYYYISDPFGIGPGDLSTYAFRVFKKDALVVYDDYCFITGTNTDNRFLVRVPEDNPEFQDLAFPNFMIVCFVEPILNGGFDFFDDLEESSVLPVTTRALGPPEY